MFAFAVLARRRFCCAKTANQSGGWLDCRCTTIGYDPEDELDELETEQEQLEYDEWYERYVEGREQPRIESNDAVEVELPINSPSPVQVSGNVANSPEKSLDNLMGSGIIELGSKFLAKNDPLYYNADKIKPIKGYDDIVFHGDPYYLIAYGNSGEEWLYNAKEAAEMIRHCQSFHGKPIRLIACQIGAEQDGIAQQIADELGVVVLAPTETVFVDIDGEMFVSNNRELAELWNISSPEERKNIHQTGTWIPFEPQKR